MLGTGVYDVNGKLIEEMDLVQSGMEIGLVTFYKDEFYFANDYMVVPLHELDDLQIVSKANKLDEYLDSHFIFN